MTKLALLLAFLGVSAASAVLDLLPDTFEPVVLKSSKPALVEFFAPWCGHCKTLAPIYDQLGERFAFASDRLVIGKVDADEHKKLGKQFGVQGFPTLKWFDGKSQTPEDYTGARDLDSLEKFVTAKTGIKPKSSGQAVPSPMAMLNDQTFKAAVGGDKHVLVAFTAPWCGHCKTLAPIFEDLARDFARESNVLIAKVDAEADNAKATAEAYGVASYPTIKYFAAGSTTPEAYEGARAAADFASFLNVRAGTHRLPGGGLDATAGTVAALDSAVAKVMGGGASAAAATLLQEVTKAAEGLADGFASYYVKVAGKVAESPGYVAKEMKRLSGLLAKGGIAAEKMDDLAARLNVLRKFEGPAAKEDL